MALFNEEIKSQLQGILNQMEDEVTVLYFTQEIECTTCRDGKEFVQEISSLSDKIKITEYNLVTDKDESEKYGVDKVPAIVVLDKNNKDTGIKFFGIPGGYEINSFLGSLLEVSGKKEEIPGDILKRIEGIDKDVHIQVLFPSDVPTVPMLSALPTDWPLKMIRLRQIWLRLQRFPIWP